MSKAIYVELDALLDTRIATIAMLDGAAAERAIMNPAYHTRDQDLFHDICGIDDELYKAAYEMRDVETLKHATLTHFPLLLTQIVREVEEQATLVPLPDSFHLEVNLWPYQLNEEERNLIELAVQRHSGLQTMVQSVFIPPHELMPAMIKERYPIVIMYNFNQWLAIQPSLFTHSKLPQTTFIAPRIHHDAPVDETSPELKDFVIHDPYLRTAKFLSIFMNLEFVPIQEFCPFRHWEVIAAAEAYEAQVEAEKLQAQTPTESA